MAEAASTSLLNLSIVAPGKAFYEGQVSYVQVPTSEGLIGILANHAALLSLLGFGLLTLKDSEGTKQIVVDGGFLEVKNNRVTVLANSAEYLSDVDVEKAKVAFDEAQRMKAVGEFQMSQKSDRIAAARTRLHYGGKKSPLTSH